MVAAAVVAVAAAVAVAVATEAAILCVPKRMNVNPGTERETHGTKKRVGQEKLVIAVAHGCTNPRAVMIESGNTFVDRKCYKGNALENHTQQVRGAKANGKSKNETQSNAVDKFTRRMLRS